MRIPMEGVVFANVLVKRGCYNSSSSFASLSRKPSTGIHVMGRFPSLRFAAAQAPAAPTRQLGLAGPQFAPELPAAPDFPR